MKTMKLAVVLSAVMILASSCSSAYYQAANGWGDDLYGVHNQQAIQQKQISEAQARKAEAEARKAEAEALLAEWEALAAGQYAGNETYSKSDYDTKYASLLSKFDGDVYVLPGSYYDLQYSGNSAYASSYTPDGQTIILADNVYVNPMYAPSMFGYWGSPSYFNYAYYPRHRYSWGYGPYYSWYDPYYYSWYDWNWNYCYRPYYDPWYRPRPYYSHHHHHYHYGYANSNSNRVYYRSGSSVRGGGTTTRSSNYVPGNRGVTASRDSRSTYTSPTRSTYSRPVASTSSNKGTVSSPRSITSTRGTSSSTSSQVTRRTYDAKTLSAAKKRATATARPTLQRPTSISSSSSSSSSSKRSNYSRPSSSSSSYSRGSSYNSSNSSSSRSYSSGSSSHSYSSGSSSGSSRSISSGSRGR